jgi:small subunit ribosomal protein S1
MSGRRRDPFKAQAHQQGTCMSDHSKTLPSGFGDDAIFRDEFTYSSDEREELEKLYDKTFSNNEENSITKGTVVNITERDVAVDIGFKSEGWIPIEEFEDPGALKIGDPVDVFIEKFEGAGGALQLSKKRADVERTWMRLKELETEGAVIEGKVVRRIKGGLVVDLMGIDAFLPGSQIDIHPVRDFDSLISKKMDFRIVKINDVRKNIVVSRKVLIEEDMREIRDKVLTELEVGQIREGVVKNITNFGVFVDLGGVDGLLHITDLSWGRVNHPSDVVKLDQKITVKVLNFDRERNRISIGLKQLLEHPWNDVEARFPISTRVAGKVVSLTRYGAFVELEPGIEGLVHISDLSWTRKLRHPGEMVKKDEKMRVQVLSFDRDERRIALGVKQLEENPWENFERQYDVGSEVECEVAKVIDKGVVVTLPFGLEGFVPNSKLRPTDLEGNKVALKEGDNAIFKVIEYDRDNKKVILATPRQLSEEAKAVAEYKKTSTRPSGGGAIADAFREAGFGGDNQE